MTLTRSEPLPPEPDPRAARFMLHVEETPGYGDLTHGERAPVAGGPEFIIDTLDALLVNPRFVRATVHRLP